MATLDFNQLHHCRVHMRRSRGLSRSLRALPAVHELTFTREDSLGIVHTNHVTQGCAAVKGTGTYHRAPWKIAFWAGMTGWIQQEILPAAGWKVCTRQLC